MLSTELDAVPPVESKRQLTKIEKNALKTKEMKESIIVALQDANGPTDLSTLANLLIDQGKEVRHQNTLLLLH